MFLRLQEEHFCKYAKWRIFIKIYINEMATNLDNNDCFDFDNICYRRNF